MVNIFKDKKFLKECAIILLVGLLVNGACFLIGTIHSKAANIVSVLPYLCQSQNEYYDEQGVQNAINAVITKYPEDNLLDKCFFVSYGYESSWYDYNNYIQVPTYCIYSCESSTLISRWSTGSNFENFEFDNSNFWVEIGFENYVGYTVRPSLISDGNIYVSRSNSSGLTYLRLFGDYSPYTINNNFFNITVPTWNYPVYTNTAFTITDTTGASGYVLAFNASIYPGDFSDLPDLDGLLNDISNNYTPHTNNPPPTYDDTLSDAQNITNAITGHANNINSAINNLGNNIKNWFDNLQDKLTQGFNSVSQNVWNGFKTLMANIKDFFGPKLDALGDKLANLVQSVTDFFAWFDEPLDAQEVQDAWNNSTIGSSLETIKNSIEEVRVMFGQILTLQRPNSLSFSVDFSNGPYPFNTVGMLYFNFDWYERVRHLVVPLIYAFLTLGFVLHFIQTLPSLIGGTGSAAEQYQLHTHGATYQNISISNGEVHSSITHRRRIQ